MNHWHFILGAYGVTLIAIVIEAIAVRMRHRAALAQSDPDRTR